MNKLIVAIVAVGFSTAAFAQAAPEFAALDTDANGNISLTEVQVAFTALTAEQFATLDKDSSGGLSAEEYVVLASAATPAGPAAPTTTPAP